jgi:hypothetical protein
MARFVGPAAMVLVCACSGGGGAGNGGQPDGAAMPSGGPDAGVPVGGSGEVTQRIGPAGGSLASADGAFTLTVPAGALAADTDLTVRTVASSAPNGVGPSYQVEPAGMHLAQPLQVAISVDPAAMGDATEDTLGIAVRNAAGDWFADLRSAGDEPTATKRRGARATGPLVTTLLFDGEDVYEVTVVTFWRVQPLVPTVNTGESVTVTVQACFEEHQTIVAGPGIDLASLPNPKCGASIREGTWSVVGAGSGNDVLGHVMAGVPSSSGVYTAPRRVPQDPVVLEVALFWRERGLTKKMRIPVMVNGTGVWTGTVEYRFTRSHTETYEGGMTTEELESTGTIQVSSRPEIVSGADATLASDSAVVSYRDTIDEVDENGGGACSSTYVRHEVIQGSEALFPSLSFAGAISLIFQHDSYIASVAFFVVVDVADDWTDTYTTRCPGEDDTVVTSSDHRDTQAPGVVFPTEAWTKPFDPASSGPITGMQHVDLDDGYALDFSWTVNPP